MELVPLIRIRYSSSAPFGVQLLGNFSLLITLRKGRREAQFWTGWNGFVLNEKEGEKGEEGIVITTVETRCRILLNSIDSQMEGAPDT